MFVILHSLWLTNNTNTPPTLREKLINDFFLCKNINRPQWQCLCRPVGHYVEKTLHSRKKSMSHENLKPRRVTPVDTVYAFGKKIDVLSSSSPSSFACKARPRRKRSESFSEGVALSNCLNTREATLKLNSWRECEIVYSHFARGNK